MSHPPRIELLWWEGCPSWEQTLQDLQDAVAAAGLDPARIVVREIEDWSDAQEERFVGSPTIRVDGRDIEPLDVPPSLSCRVYRLRDGRPSPTPDPDDLRDALARVAARA